MRNMKSSSQSIVHRPPAMAVSSFWRWTVDRRLWTLGCFISVCLLSLTSCNEYLDETPDNRVELNTLDKASQLLTNAYSPAGYNFVEWMADQVTFTQGTRKQQNQLRTYQWEETNADPDDQDTPEYFWNGTYEAIAHANEVLAVIDQLPGNEAQRNAVRGEALLTRAYGHFMLVNMFAKHYDEATASSDLGVPYVTTPETEFLKEYRRNTVAQVYDRVEADLLEGLELVDDTFYANSGKYHFTRNAALAFASRFYLYKRDLNECIRYSDALLGNNPDTYVKDIPALLRQRINTEDYIRLYTSPDDASNILLLRQETIFYRNVGFFPDNNLYNGLFNSNPFGATDLRADPAYRRGEDGIIATRFENLFQRTSITSDVGLPYTIFLGFRGEEVLLNRAEAYALQNRLDEAIADLQALSNKRYDIPVTLDLETLQDFIGTDDPRLAVLIYIIELERPKEFIHEGLRWFDIKRYGIAVEHTLGDGSVITLEQEDNRKALQIPEAAQEIGGLKPNPR